MDEEKVDASTRAIGWLIAGVAGFGFFVLVDLLDDLDLSNLAKAFIVVPMGWFGFMCLLMLIEKFDLEGKRK